MAAAASSTAPLPREQDATDTNHGTAAVEGAPHAAPSNNSDTADVATADEAVPDDANIDFEIDSLRRVEGGGDNDHTEDMPSSGGRVVSPVMPGQGSDDNDFPSIYICPFFFEPPVNGVYFDIIGTDGQLSQQVFEYSSIYRYIITIEGRRQTSHRYVNHPYNGGRVRRDGALALVRPVSNETQAILNAERTRRQLELVDSNPLSDDDRLAYDQMLVAVASP